MIPPWPEGWPETWVQPALSTTRSTTTHDRIVHTLAQLRAAHLIQHVHPVRLLDLACGDGQVVRSALQLAGHAADHIGLDIEDRGLFPPAKFVLGDMHDAPRLLRPKFDLILCLHAAYRSNDRPRFLRTIASALAPGGLAAVDFWTDRVFRAHKRYDAPGFGELLYGWLRCDALDTFAYPGSFEQEVDEVMRLAVRPAGLDGRVFPFLGPTLTRYAYRDYREVQSQSPPLPIHELLHLLMHDPGDVTRSGGAYFTVVLSRAR